MSDLTAMHYATIAVAYFAAFVPWIFVVLYQWRTHGAWRRDVLGWHIMALTAVDGGVFSMILAAMWWPWLGLHASYEWCYLAMIAGIPIVTVWRAIILLRLYSRSNLSVVPDPTDEGVEQHA